jgi:hypothetical protein
MTMKHPRHVASDKLFSELAESVDKFIEVYIGKYGRPKITDFDIKVINLNNKTIIDFLTLAVNKLTDITLDKIDLTKDTDLLNIRDEIIGAINQTLYLFTLE